MCGQGEGGELFFLLLYNDNYDEQTFSTDQYDNSIITLIDIGYLQTLYSIHGLYRNINYVDFTVITECGVECQFDSMKNASGT